MEFSREKRAGSVSGGIRIGFERRIILSFGIGYCLTVLRGSGKFAIKINRYSLFMKRLLFPISVCFHRFFTLAVCRGAGKHLLYMGRSHDRMG